MKIKADGKYAIIPITHVAVPIDSLPFVMKESVVLLKQYDTTFHKWNYVLQEEQAIAVDIVDGEQILADSASHRLLGEKE